MKVCSHPGVSRFAVAFSTLTAIKQALKFSVYEIKAHAVGLRWVRFMVKCHRKCRPAWVTALFPTGSHCSWWAVLLSSVGLLSLWESCQMGFAGRLEFVQREYVNINFWQNQTAPYRGLCKEKFKCIQWGLVLVSPVCVRNAVCVSSVSSQSVQQRHVYAQPLRAQHNINSNSIKTGTGFCMTVFPFS